MAINLRLPISSCRWFNKLITYIHQPHTSDIAQITQTDRQSSSSVCSAAEYLCFIHFDMAGYSFHSYIVWGRMNFNPNHQKRPHPIPSYCSNTVQRVLTIALSWFLQYEDDILLCVPQQPMLPLKIKVSIIRMSHAYFRPHLERGRERARESARERGAER